MRRTVLNGIVLTVSLAAGCGTPQQYRNIGRERSEPVIDSGLTRVSGTLSEREGAAASDEPAAPPLKRAFAKRNVPDSVMLRDEADSRYRDEVVPN
jgi:hypothetical protein